MHDYRGKIDESLTNAQKQLDSLHSEIARSLEKITSREKYVNAELDPLLTEYRNLQVRTNYFGLWHVLIFCSNTSIFVDFGYDWYFMFRSFNVQHKKKDLKSP